MQSTARRPPRPPNEGPADHRDGPGWVSAPPPAYHQGQAVSLDEPLAPQVVPRPPRAPAATPLPDTPPALVPALEATRPIRCPKCATVFDWTASRPTTVTCPECGARGTIR